MQTFVTYFSHAKTMRDLDRERLGKQRVETLQILRALRGETDAYTNHPAVRMWEGYEPALTLYGLFVCHEWRVVRKFEDKTWGDFAHMAIEYGMVVPPHTPADVTPPETPPWLRDKWVLRSHRSNLVRKAPHIYGEKYTGTPENMPYLWPVIEPKHQHGYYLRLSKPDAARLEAGERELPDGLSVMECITLRGLRENYAVVTPEEG